VTTVNKSEERTERGKNGALYIPLEREDSKI
jgi:hypothetical protein